MLENLCKISSISPLSIMKETVENKNKRLRRHYISDRKPDPL